MKLGSSLRRRRKGGRPGTPKGKERGKDGDRRSWGITALVAVGAAALAYGSGWLVATQLLFPAPEPPEDFVEVPDLRGVGLEGALGRLREAGLQPGPVDSLRHPSVDSGAVVGQAPLPGQLSLPGDTVRVAVSLGPERGAVPDVLGLRGTQAANLLQATGFEVTVDSVEADVPQGRVMEVEPDTGTSMALPGQVRLVVSLGPPLVPMPDLLGMPEELALDSLEALGLAVVAVDTLFRFGRDQGLVVEQEPPADSLLERGTAVRLAVGRRGRGGGRDATDPPGREQ